MRAVLLGVGLWELGVDVSSPSFAWDDWYALVGGRSIRIEEVDDILRQIYNDQYRAIRR